MGHTYFDLDGKHIRYYSGDSLYTESFENSMLLCSAIQDNGLAVYGYDEVKNKPSFDLTVDGEALYYGWRDAEFSEEEQGNGRSRAVIHLRHESKQISLKVITYLNDAGVFTRNIEITNDQDKPCSITSHAVLTGIIWPQPQGTVHDEGSAQMNAYSVGHFRNFDWGYEGSFQWTDIPANTGLDITARYGKSGWNHPFFILRNNIDGGYMFCQLEWAGNWSARFQYDYKPAGNSAVLHFSIGPSSVPPARVIESGETVIGPAVHFCVSHTSFDDVIQKMHSYQRRYLFKRHSGLPQPVIYNNWGYMEHELSEQRLKDEIDIAVETGAELFVIDAGWFGNMGTAWADTVGDWVCGDRLPSDLYPVFEYARSKGLKYGLWVEIESAAEKSILAAKHPDWFIQRYGTSINRPLDLAKPEVARFIEQKLTQIIEKYQLDMLRIDFNNNYNEGGFNKVHGVNENSLWKHCESIYAIMGRIGSRFPDLILENCAGGGGRTDIGQVCRFNTTWVSDWMRMPRTVRILNGMSMVLPPEYINRMFGVVMKAGYYGNIDTQLHVLVMSHFSLSGLVPEKRYRDASVLSKVRKYVDIYKGFVRGFHSDANVYHHTPVIPGPDADGWCALEYVSKDRKKAVAAVFRLKNTAGNRYLLRLKGLDPSSEYTVTVEPNGDSFTADGFQLINQGIEIDLDLPLTSKLFLIKQMIDICEMGKQ
jgi:alpha-galactosidase